MALFTERMYCESKPRVENGVIHGVKIIGNESVNGRRYPRAVREKARGRYEGARVNIDHPGRGQGVDRSFRDWVGVIENVQVRDDGNFGDLRLRQKHPDYESIVEAAEEFWKDFGLSHVAECDSKRCGDIDEVTEINEVFSVDIVTEPATTSSLIESRNRNMAATGAAQTKTITLKEVVERLPADNPQRKTLLEMAGSAVGSGYDLGTLAIEPQAEGQDSLASQLAAALVEMTRAAMALAARNKSAGDNPPPNAGNAANNDSNSADDEELEMDDTKTRLANLESELRQQRAKNLLLESGREATDIRIKTLAALEGDEQKSLLESWPKQETAVREQRQRPRTSPPAMEGGRAGGSDKAPDDIFKERAERLKESRQRQFASAA